jgi:hypothetical protein
VWDKQLLREKFRKSYQENFNAVLSDAEVRLMVRRIESKECDELRRINRSRRWYLCEHKGRLFAGLFTHTHGMLILAKQLDSVLAIVDEERDSASLEIVGHAATRFDERANMRLSKPVLDAIVEMISSGDAKLVSKSKTTDRCIYEVDLGDSAPRRVVYSMLHNTIVTLLPSNPIRGKVHNHRFVKWLDRSTQRALTELVHEGKARSVSRVNHNRYIYQLDTPRGPWLFLYCRRRKIVLGIYEENLQDAAA